MKRVIGLFLFVTLGTGSLLGQCQCPDSLLSVFNFNDLQACVSPWYLLEQNDSSHVTDFIELKDCHGTKNDLQLQKAQTSRNIYLTLNGFEIEENILLPCHSNDFGKYGWPDGTGLCAYPIHKWVYNSKSNKLKKKIIKSIQYYGTSNPDTILHYYFEEREKFWLEDSLSSAEADNYEFYGQFPDLIYLGYF